MTFTYPKTVLMAASCGICLAVPPAMAFEPSSDAEKLLVSWLEEGSCTMSQKDFMGKALSKPGVPPSELMKARRAMTKSGVIRKGSGNSMTLTAGSACGDVKVAEPTYDSGSEKDVLVGKLIAVFENNECVLTERSARDLFEAEGLTRAQLDIAGEALEDDGAFKETDAGLQLIIGKCADFVAEAPEGDDTSRVMAMFEQNSCSLTEDQLPDVAQQFQVTRKQFRTVTKPMEKSGALKEDGDKITLTIGDVCGGQSSAEASASEDTPEAASKLLIKLAEDNNCSLTEDLVESFMEDKSGDFSPSSLDDAFDLLEDNGSIVIAEDRMSARLVKGDLCEKAVEAFEPQTDDERKVIALFEENGCTLNEDALPALAEKYELDKQAFRTAGRALMKAGVFVEQGDDITLLGGKCADGAEDVAGEEVAEEAASEGDDKRSIVVRAFEENGCSMTKDVARKELEAVGLDVVEDRDLVRGMIKDGILTLGADRDTATLVTGDVCGSDVVVAAPTAAGDKRSQVIALFEQNGCRLNEEQAIPLFAAIGLDLDNDADIEIINDLFEAGDIIEGASDEAILVTGDVCERPEMSIKDTVMTAFSENDCAMTEDDFETAMAEAGVSVDEAGEVVEAMIEGGDASYDRDTRQAKLLIGACAQ